MGIEKVSIIYDQRRAEGKPWLVRYFGEGSETACPKRYCKSFKTKREAERFATEHQHAFDAGGRRDRVPNVRLEQFAQDWLKAKQPELRSGTLDLYREVLDKLMDYFGKTCLLGKITPGMPVCSWPRSKGSSPPRIRINLFLTGPGLGSF